MSWLNWNALNNTNKQTDTKEQYETSVFKQWDLCKLKDLKSMAHMNGKLCKIAGGFDNQEQRYPVLMIETNEIIQIKPCNLAPMPRHTVYVKDVILYPIKGCKGISLSEAQTDERGLKYDRLYCLMSTKTRRIITQSGYNGKPKMCWIESMPDENGIHISAPNMSKIYIPKTCESNMKVSLKYWNYKQGIHGYDQGNAASKWLTQYFISNKYDRNDEIRLVLFDPNFKRYTHTKDTSLRYANNNRNKPSIVSFTNDFQFLVCSEESLLALNDRIKSGIGNGKYNPKLDKIKMDRFRPNIVLSSNGHSQAHFEDTFKLFAINEIKFYYTKPCVRCGMPSVNQQTAKRYKEPKNTLTKYRSGQQLGYLREKCWKLKLFFGSYFIHDQCGEIQRGAIVGI